jgi:hypothetical protein
MLIGNYLYSKVERLHWDSFYFTHISYIYFQCTPIYPGICVPILFAEDDGSLLGAVCRVRYSSPRCAALSILMENSEPSLITQHEGATHCNLWVSNYVLVLVLVARERERDSD